MRDALLAQVLANPDDDGPRLVYADWLSSQGDSRGELITVQCALEHATGAERARLVNHASNLLYRNGEWFADVKQLVRGCETRRGFVSSINATATMFAACGSLFEREPIDALRLISPTAQGIADLCRTPHLARLRSIVCLDVLRIDIDKHVRSVRDLVTSPRLVQLRSLDLRIAVALGCEAGVIGIVAALALPALATLKIHISQGDGMARPDVVYAALAEADLPALRRLAIRSTSNIARLQAAFPAATVVALDA